jgi:hypothetical protein
MTPEVNQSGRLPIGEVCESALPFTLEVRGVQCFPPDPGIFFSTLLSLTLTISRSTYIQTLLSPPRPSNLTCNSSVKFKPTADTRGSFVANSSSLANCLCLRINRENEKLSWLNRGIVCDRASSSRRIQNRYVALRYSSFCHLEILQICCLYDGCLLG